MTIEVCMFVCLFVCLFACLFVCLFVCLFICLFVLNVMVLKDKKMRTITSLPCDISFCGKGHFKKCMVSVSCDWLPAVYEYRFISCLPLDFREFLNDIHHTLEVRAHSIWSPACDVELSHLVGLFGLNVNT